MYITVVGQISTYEPARVRIGQASSPSAFTPLDELRAVATNFRDVLSALEKAFDGGDKIGSEYAGTVRRVRVGASGTEFQLRHRVCTAIIMFYTGGTTFFLRPAY